MDLRAGSGVRGSGPAVAGGADCIAGVGHNGAVIGDASSAPPPRLPRFGGWSMRPLPGIRAARAHAWARAWAAGAAPGAGQWLHLDVDATITIDHPTTSRTRWKS